MISHKALEPSALRRRCDPKQFSFKTTDELEDVPGIVGQPRAVEAVKFGLEIQREGYNIFAIGPIGTGKHSLVRQFLEERALSAPVPDDWCYVANFEQPHKPCALHLPPGQGSALRQDMEEIVEQVVPALHGAFALEENRARYQIIQEGVQTRQNEVLNTLHAGGLEQNLLLTRSEEGLYFVPAEQGEALAQEALQALPAEQQEAFLTAAQALQEELVVAVQDFPLWEQEAQGEMQAIEREINQAVIEQLLLPLMTKYEAQPPVITYLDTVRQDMIKEANSLYDLGRKPEAGAASDENAAPPSLKESPLLRRYQVNVLVEHGSTPGAPVIYEDHPTYQKLIGRVEYIAQMGTLGTDFTLIRPGALHLANGGYLILDAQDVLASPLVWHGLKRALQAGHVRIESPEEAPNPFSTITLEPAAIPLKLKVALLGSRGLYYYMIEADSDFSELFKVQADFSDEMEWTPENQQLYAQLLGTLARKEGLRALDRTGVARVIEQSARMAEDASQLSTHIREVVDLLGEADYWAAQLGHKIIGAADVQRAIDAQVYRANRIQALGQEHVLRETIHIDTTGARIGQINGLSVLQLGTYAFGRPSRITARVRLGRGELLDIEREVALGGPLHSKGVLILAGFLGARYSPDHPLSLSASLVFEQSYGGVDGDSASSAELYALLSTIGQVPLKQSFAVTGAVDQYGRVQAIGGVNEKIEGFFDLCKARELTGEQGVLIPASNVQHLMLKQEVIDAVAAGRFHIYLVASIDQGIELLTGLPAGEADEQGTYPPESVNGRVQARLHQLAHEWLKWNVAPRND